ncbi:mediator of RNA polymerase II transcription subunit 28 [Biomphalaria pfeifferi]|uniref:Mediator of RNA polymerase II transcription subunit 28 n=1 Tax=Biomphalaria pfeifferi TaxID=112525 RepID=A0AAD8CCE9_BIOPF|nr:mediator of RNA polymerase II transcription subunit 28 [Biomphalaria pfeifferi]
MANENCNVGASHLVDDFEAAFQNCVSLLTSQENFNVQDSEETKMSVENSLQRFLESARQMETFFLNKRLILSVARPEHVLNEDILELKAEFERKEKLIEKHHEKLPKWQALLRSNASAMPTSPYSGSQPQSHQNMVPGPPMSTSVGPSMGASANQPMMSQQMTSMAPGQYPGPPAGHPGQYNMPPPAYPQGPLAYLERM